MDALGKELGVSTMAPYRHFKSRDEILQRAASLVWQEAMREIDFTQPDPIELATAAAVTVRRCMRRHNDISMVALPRRGEFTETTTQSNIFKFVQGLFAVNAEKAYDVAYAWMTITMGAAKVEANTYTYDGDHDGPAVVLEQVPAVSYLAQKEAGVIDETVPRILHDDLASGKFELLIRATLTALLEN